MAGESKGAGAGVKVGLLYISINSCSWAEDITGSPAGLSRVNGVRLSSAET